MSTKNNPGPFNCYKAAAPDEPIFTLKASDITAPLVINFWANLYRERKEYAGEFNERAKQKHAEALICAEEMTTWFNAHKG